MAAIFVVIFDGLDFLSAWNRAYKDTGNTLTQLPTYQEFEYET